MNASLSSPLDTFTAITTRRAIKSFKDEAIPPEMLQRLVELTVAAPSSYNLQDWRIVLVQSAAQRQALTEAAFGQQQVQQAPVTFVFTASTTAWQDEALMEQIYQTALERGAWPQKTVDYFKQAIPQFQENLGERRREYAIKDAMIAATHTALAAEAMGLSSGFLNGWQEDAVKKVIGAEDRADIVVAVLLAIGFAAEPRKNPGRLPLSTNVFVNSLDTPYSA
nr:nitroreductase family protein [Halomicronema sp. CCY15110]